MTPAHSDRHDQAGPPGALFRRVLVAWDGSPDSVAALRTAAAMVGDGPGHVVALAVMPGPPHAEAEGEPGGEPAGTHWVREGFAQARAAITATSRARIDLHTAAGRQAARSLCDYAAEHGFDLLVLGRHGDGGVLHPRLGHVAEAAARLSTIPVLLVSAR
jgi:nucleotide-binding universal stress UspA family protein